MLSQSLAQNHLRAIYTRTTPKQKDTMLSQFAAKCDPLPVPLCPRFSVSALASMAALLQKPLSYVDPAFFFVSEAPSMLKKMNHLNRRWGVLDIRDPVYGDTLCGAESDLPEKLSREIKPELSTPILHAEVKKVLVLSNFHR
ncbi:hypothetical protein SDC9_101728 [bioreactor metagenome]|uniref:Uncharacterized protein n=1 Tax=bioreactor metagenome TaxID=1076179 RepID=A0A645ANX7_9ZZZZ